MNEEEPKPTGAIAAATAFLEQCAPMVGREPRGRDARPRLMDAVDAVRALEARDVRARQLSIASKFEVGDVAAALEALDDDEGLFREVEAAARQMGVAHVAAVALEVAASLDLMGKAMDSQFGLPAGRGRQLAVAETLEGSDPYLSDGWTRACALRCMEAARNKAAGPMAMAVPERVRAVLGGAAVGWRPSAMASGGNRAARRRRRP